MTTETTEIPFTEGPRYANMMLGVWLFLTAFAWRDAPATWANTWIVGLRVVASAIWGLRNPGVWRLNALLGLWLIVASIVLPHTLSATRWNNAVVGFLIAVIAGIAWATSSGPLLATRRP